MTAINLGLVVCILFFILVILKVPVYISLLVPSMTYFVYQGFPISFHAQRLTYMLDSTFILTVPLFIFAGTLMNHSGITEIIFDFANDVVGHVSGGLAHVNIFVSVIFSGISGSALADIGGVGKVMIERMKYEDYSSGYSAALTGSSAVIGPIFPPSIPLIVFGIVAEVSVLALLIAGIGPAVALAIILIIITALLARIRDFPVDSTRPPLRKILGSFLIALPAISTPVVLIAGMMLGFFGPTEAAAVTVVYILLINLLVYRNISMNYVSDAAIEATRTTGTVLIILASAGLFTYIMSVESVDQLFASFLLNRYESPIFLMLMVNIFLLIIGAIIDTMAALIMSVPIVVPPLIEVGYDPVHIGIVIVLNLMIGMLTPPLGISLFLASDIADASIKDTLIEMKYYYVSLIFGLLIIIFFPQISLIPVDMVNN